MVWLEALLAFALTMLVFSTIVTLIIEAIHRLFQMRQTGLRLLVGQLFDRFVWPRFGAYLASATQGTLTQEKAREEFVKGLTGDESRVDADKGGALKKYFLPPKLTSLTAMQFAERLAQTEVGAVILSKAQGEIDALVKDLVQKFDRLGTEASEFFRQRSQLFAVLIGFVLAFVANFDAITVFKTYLKEDDLRQSIVANAEAIQKQYLDAAEKLRQIESAAAPANQEKPAEAAQALRGEIAKRRDEIEKALSELRAKGVPIGWSYFPFCHRPEVGAVAAEGSSARTRDYLDSRCSAVLERKHRRRMQCAAKGVPPAVQLGPHWLAWIVRTCLAPGGAVPESLDELTIWDPFAHAVAPLLYWLVSVLVAGALIGLGGPFWYDAVRSLSFVLQLLKPLAQVAKPGTPAPGGTDAAKARAGEIERAERQPTTPVEAFKAAGESQKILPATDIGRAPLDARGEPMRI